MEIILELPFWFILSTILNICVATSSATVIEKEPLHILNSTSKERRSPVEDNSLTTLFSLWGFVGCKDSETQAIKDAMDEVRVLLDSPGSRDIDEYWDSYAFVEYFGPPILYQNVRKEIKTVYANALNFRNHWWNGQDAQVFCHEKPGTNKGDTGSCGRTTQQSILVQLDGGKANTLALVFCDRWFIKKPLYEVYDKASTGSKKWDLSAYDNRACHWITAMVQMPTINTFIASEMKFISYKFPTLQWNPVEPSDPMDPVWPEPIKPEPPKVIENRLVVGAAECKYVSKTHMEKNVFSKAISNPNIWSWYALASYVQHKLGEYPHRPLVPKDLLSMRRKPIPADEITEGDEITEEVLPDDPAPDKLDRMMYPNWH